MTAGPDGAPESSVRRADAITLDTASLRAMAHPVRVRMIALLRQQGASTATRLAAELGLNTGATSYHLRQLAGAGLIAEDTERGSGRDRWWRPMYRSTYLEPAAVPDSDRPVAEVYLNAIAAEYADRVRRYAAQLLTLPPVWRDAGTISDWRLQLTPDEATELVRRLVEIVESYRRADDPGDAPPKAEPVVLQLQAMVQVDAGLGEVDRGAAAHPAEEL